MSHNDYLPDYIEVQGDKTSPAPALKDSGTRQKFQTGAVRDAQVNKGRFDLIPPFALLLLSLIYELGAKKYADRNWEKGMPLSRYLESAQRHIQKYIAGLRDEPHLSMAFWNIAGALHTAAMVYLGVYPDKFNDLPNHLPTDKPLVLNSLEIEAIEGWFPTKGIQSNK